MENKVEGLKSIAARSSPMQKELAENYEKLRYMGREEPPQGTHATIEDKKERWAVKLR